jgi:uncharacterized protein YbjT (DUF2867 family)
MDGPDARFSSTGSERVMARIGAEMSGKRVLLNGATGMVGGSALRLCLDDPAVSKVKVLGRRSVGLEHDKLREVLHEDFQDYTSVLEHFKDHDVALFCLGVYTGAVPDEEFRRITVDYTDAFARALFQQSPEAAFCFLSGRGADQTEKSRIAFSRYKGEAENLLLGVGFPRVHIFRPGYIYPVSPRDEPNLMYRVSRALYPVLRRIYSNMGISSEDLAQAMVRVGVHGAGDHESPILENRDIRAQVG